MGDNAQPDIYPYDYAQYPTWRIWVVTSSDVDPLFQKALEAFSVRSQARSRFDEWVAQRAPSEVVTMSVYKLPKTAKAMAALINDITQRKKPTSFPGKLLWQSPGGQ